MTEKLKEKNVEQLDRIKLANLNRLNKTSSVMSSKNNWFYLAIILINMVSLAVAWLIESNNNGVATGVIDSIDYRYFYLLVASLCIMVLLKVVPDFVFLYRNTKQRCFLTIVRGNIIREHYNTLTSKKDVINSLYIENLKESNVSDQIAKEMTNSQYVASKIAQIIYAFVIMFVGSIFALNKTNIFLYVLAIIGLLISIAWLLIIVYFDKYKAKYLIIIGSLCKFLYKIKLIKNYEKMYNLLVVKIIQFGSVFKKNNIYILLQISCGVLIKFITHCMLFILLCAFDIPSGDLFIEVLFKCELLDIIIGLLPMPKGIFVYEILFLTLFRSVFMSGCLLYAMVMYRVLTYFLIQIIFGLCYICGFRKKLISISDKISKEIELNN